MVWLSVMARDWTGWTY